jgi:hypothetical protein
MDMNASSTNGVDCMAEQRAEALKVHLVHAAVLLLVVAVPGFAADAAEARDRRARVPAFAAPVPEPRPTQPQPGPSGPAEAQQAVPFPSAAPDGMAEDCASRLAAMGVTFARPIRPTVSDARCAIEDAVQLDRMQDGAVTIRWPDRPILACAMAERFAGFTRDAVRPMARSIGGAELVAVGTGNGFECRPRNRQAGAKLSAHGQGLAVDIAWFELEGRRRISVETPGSDADHRFLAAVRKAACGWFTTVLGPGSDAAHANHLHLDAERRGRDGQSRLCQ